MLTILTHHLYSLVRKRRSQRVTRPIPTWLHRGQLVKRTRLTEIVTAERIGRALFERGQVVVAGWGEPFKVRASFIHQRSFVETEGAAC